MWLCSNKSCPDKTKLSEGSVCSSCGGSAQLFGFRKSIQHLNSKDRAVGPSHVQLRPKAVGRYEILVSPEMSDEEIEKLIHEDLREASVRLSSVIRDVFDDIDEDTPESQLLQMLVNQNKIVIRQNELILRAIKSRPLESSG